MRAPCFNGKFVAANSELGKGYSVFVHSYPGEVLLILEFCFEHPIGSQCSFLAVHSADNTTCEQTGHLVVSLFHSHGHLRCQKLPD